MNEKQKSEGQLLESIFKDNRSEAQSLLNLCKERENQQILIPVQLDSRTIFFVPAGTNIEKFRNRKTEELERFRYKHYKSVR